MLSSFPVFFSINICLYLARLSREGWMLLNLLLKSFSALNDSTSDLNEKYKSRSGDDDLHGKCNSSEDIFILDFVVL